MPLSRDDILNAQDLITDYVEVPQWGGKVKVRAIPVAHKDFTRFVDRLEKIQLEKGRPAQFSPPNPEERERRRVIGAVIMGAIDEEGNRLFDWADADRLREKYYWACCDVAAKAFELAGREETTVKDIDEGKESSEIDPGFDSSTD